MTKIGGLDVLTADVAMPYIGIWHVDGEASADATISGAQVLEDHGVTFSGTILRATVIGGRLKFRMVGGKGKLSQDVPAAHWNRPTLGTIIRDTLAACGEILSSTVSSAVLTARVDQWKRNEGPASRALQAICDHEGLIWRVLRDGTVWVGPEEYPTAKVKHVLIDEDWSAGVIDIAPEAPDLLPGVTFRDQRIRYVKHSIRQNSLRSEACLETPSGLLDRFLAGIRQEVYYSRSYPARVIAQNANGTLQLEPDDPKIRGKGLNNVPIRIGIPGFVARVSSGARVGIEFENGDPSKPKATDWDHDASKVESVEFQPGGLNSPVARVGDELEVTFPMGLPIVTSLGPATIIINTPAKAIITGPGNAKLKA